MYIAGYQSANLIASLLPEKRPLTISTALFTALPAWPNGIAGENQPLPFAGLPDICRVMLGLRKCDLERFPWRRDAPRCWSKYWGGEGGTVGALGG